MAATKASIPTEDEGSTTRNLESHNNNPEFNHPMYPLLNNYPTTKAGTKRVRILSYFYFGFILFFVLLFILSRILK